jgi:hypothetical protein
MGSSPTTPNTPSNQVPNNNIIRNISQSVQEREIVKTAPDLVVYLEGYPYLVNYFINDPNTKNTFTIVNFNDYITSFNTSYDVEMLVPNCSFTLVVPNYFKHLFVMPGGNNLIESMMQVQVFAKGYYMSNEGDTVLRRVFKGVVVNISYADNGKTLEISVQCHGSLHFLELMQVNLAPALMHNGTKEVHVTEFQSVMHSLNLYQIIAGIFLLSFQGASGFDVSSINQGKVDVGQFGQAVKKGYIAKWEAILANLAKDVHLYGTSYKDHAKFSALFKRSEVKGTQSKEELPDAQAYKAVDNEVAQASNIYYKKIRQYLPDNIISDITMLNNKIMSRMEALRHYVQMTNFEAYQDVDGKIIIKPPLYNLDVTYLGPRSTKTSTTGTNSTQTGTGYYSVVDPATEIFPDTNPFVVHLSEILTEQETEDETQVRKTRITCNGVFASDWTGVQQKDVMSVVDFIDVQKLQQFGLREEPSITVPWMTSGDKFYLWAYAVTELTRANLAYRTYTITIPLRPELKVGFPMFIPHKDMYGYIKSIGINYNVGSTATMTVTLVGLRRRVLIPTVQSTGGGHDYTAYTSAPNLVMKYTTAPPPQTQPQTNPNQSSSTQQSYFAPWYQELTQGGATQYGSLKPSTTSPADPKGVATTPIPAAPPTQNAGPQSGQSLLPSNQQLMVKMVRELQQPDFSIQQDTTYNSWQIQNDTGQVFGLPGVWPNNIKQRLVDQSYINDCRKTFPYTDDKGYELIGVLPWGRWQNLRTALLEFTTDGYITQTTDQSGNPSAPPDLAIATGTEALVFAGLGTPTATAQTANQLYNYLSQVNQAVTNDTVIVLKYTAGSTNDSQLLNTAQPDINNAIVQAEIANSTVTQTNQIDVLVTGSVAPTAATQAAFLAATTPNPSAALSPAPAPPAPTPPANNPQTQNLNTGQYKGTGS